MHLLLLVGGALGTLGLEFLVQVSLSPLSEAVQALPHAARGCAWAGVAVGGGAG